MAVGCTAEVGCPDSYRNRNQPDITFDGLQYASPHVSGEPRGSTSVFVNETYLAASLDTMQGDD